MSPNLTLAAVKYAALLLIEANDQTTTLEVKNLLRDLGYRATQSDVSDLMIEAADELPLEFSANGPYRVYRLPSSPTAVLPNTTTTSNNVVPSHGSNIAPLVYTRRDGRKIYAYNYEPNQMCVNDFWKTVEVNDDLNPLYIDATQYTRDDARNAYASLRQVNFADTRACRV